MSGDRPNHRPAGDPLAVVLRVRRLDEERARLVLAEALAHAGAIRARLDAVAAEHAAACAALAERLGGSVGAAVVAEATAAVEVAERRRAGLAAELELAERRVGEARIGLAAATRRREAVEQVRERRLAERRRELERRLERELTEIALVRRAWAAAGVGA